MDEMDYTMSDATSVCRRLILSETSLSTDIASGSSSSSSPLNSNLLGSFARPHTTAYSDRFIPSRSGSNLSGFALLDKPPSTSNSVPSSSSLSSSSTDGTHNNNNNNNGREDGSAAYSVLLRTELFGREAAAQSLSPSATPEKPLRHPSNSPYLSSSSSSSIDASKKSPMTPSKNLFRFKSDLKGGSPGSSKADSPFSLSPVGVDAALTGAIVSPRKAPRKIARSPFKVLDAPALQDDFYLNLVDWSSHNILSVGLGTCVYLWSACTSKVTKLCDLSPNDGVCSVSWTQRGTYLAVGTSSGEVQIWDAAWCKKVRTMGGHRTRVGTLAWSSHILSSGSRDRNILQRDIRVQDDFVCKLAGHKSEVCGLKWSCDDRELASGGNDNQLFIWNQQSTQPILKYSEHTAAVKAIAWSPHQHGLLASGGGTIDRCIRFWNTSTNTHLNCVDTGSQLATLTGHTLRVLYLAISPDGQTIVTGAGDETLRFWNVFPSPKSQSVVRDTGMWSLGRTHIR